MVGAPAEVTGKTLLKTQVRFQPAAVQFRRFKSVIFWPTRLLRATLLSRRVWLLGCRRCPRRRRFMLNAEDDKSTVRAHKKKRRERVRW